MMLKKTIYLSLLILSACDLNKVQVPDIEVCTIEGIIDAGAVCATTNSNKVRRMGIDEFILFLEPNETRAGAMCLNTDGWVALKTALQQACNKNGEQCDYKKVTSVLKLMDQQIERAKK